jgi:AcrR family transcriptional regulator
MEQIAQEADVAKGTTYLYYRSKQNIYDAALSRGLAELDDWTREAVDRAFNLHDAIAAFVTARAQYFLEHRDFFRMYVAAISRQITSVKPRASEFQAMVDRQTRRLEDAIRRGVSRGEIRHVDPAAAALAIFDLTRGLVARGIVATQAFDIEREVAFVTSLVWTGLGLERESAAARARRGVAEQRVKRTSEKGTVKGQNSKRRGEDA